MQINWKSKKVIVRVALFLIVFILFVSTSGASSEELTKKDEEIAGLKTEIAENEKVISEQISEIAALTEKVEEAKPWFDLTEKEKEQKIAEQKAIEEAEAKKKAEEAAAKKAAEEAAAKKAAEEAAAAEAEAKRKAEEEARIGYDTGITFDQLARTPDDFIGEKVKFHGKVVQVMEGDGEVEVRIAVNDDYDTIIYGAYESSIVDSRVLEDDMITVMGVSAGLLTYESTMGGEITIPSILIEKIDQ